MKIKKLYKKIYINLSILALISAIFIALVTFSSSLIKSSQDNLKAIKQETLLAKSKAIELEGKFKDAIKYRDFWQKINEKRRETSPVKIDDVNKILDEIAAKHGILNPSIKMLVPNQIEFNGFKTKTIKVMHANGELSFESLNDVNSVLFIQDFSSNMPGNFIATSVKMEKGPAYNSEQLVRISRGEKIANSKVTLNFAWYSYRETKERKENQKNSDILPN
jgi:hypothetical protein